MRAVEDGLAWFASATAFAVSMSGSPGPNNTMLTASGATFGFRPTVPHMLGVAIGLPVMLLALALGVGELLLAAPWLHDAMRWVGAAYMLWLAWKIAMADPAPAGASGAAGSRPLTFLQAALFQWVNPKAWVVALGAIAAYTTTTGLALVGQVALLGAIFLVVAIPITAGWTLVGVGAARLLRTRRALRLFNLAMAALLVASLLPMLRG